LFFFIPSSNVHNAYLVLGTLQGISQTLLIARIGLSRILRPQVPVSKHTGIVFAGGSLADARSGVMIIVGGQDVEMDAMHGWNAAPSVEE
jgi:hypothetical protein